MSRLGKQPIPIPKGVEVKITGNKVTIKGPKGTLSQELFHGIQAKVEGSEIIVTIDDEDPKKSKFHGLYRTLLFNMVHGTSNGFEKKLEMIGVGYRAAVAGTALDLQIGFSHPTKLPIPQGLAVKVDKNTVIVISGIDKQSVGQFAATVRAIRPPEPYQGKGIRYEGEYVRKKAGKAAATAKSGK
jgi:large subunit ribosomal protein L6